MIEILIDNRNGNVWDASEIVEGFTWDTARVGKSASVDFSLALTSIYGAREFGVNNGDVVRIKKGDINIFYGYVFSLSQDRYTLKIKAYDQIRYLMNKDTQVMKNFEVGDLIKKIAKEFNLKVGTIDNTGYRIPTLVEDAQSLIDIIEKANSFTIGATSEIFVFYDDFGKLSYRNVKNFKTDIFLGEGSLVAGYGMTRDIDSDTFNVIKLYKDNKKSGRRDVYETKDSANIAKWGILQYYESVDENMNDAQIKELMSKLAKLKNKESTKLQLDCIGDLRVRAGMYINVYLEKLGFNGLMLVESVKHDIKGVEHTMNVEMRVI